MEEKKKTNKDFSKELMNESKKIKSTLPKKMQMHHPWN